MKEAALDAAEEHLKRKKRKSWLSNDTLKIIEEKQMAFIRCQEDRTDTKRNEAYSPAQQVGRAVTSDKEKWLNRIMHKMEEDMRRHHLGDFYKTAEYETTTHNHILNKEEELQ